MIDEKTKERFQSIYEKIMNLFWLQVSEFGEKPRDAYDILNVIAEKRKRPEIFNKSEYESRRQWDMFPYLKDLEYEEIEDFTKFFKDTVREMISCGTFTYKNFSRVLTTRETQSLKNLLRHL